MSLFRSVIDDLETTLQSGSAARRHELLRRVTDLFLGGADNFSEDQILLFDDVMSRLISHIEERALAELSLRLAPIANAPVGVIRRLACDDDIVISGPVLEQSERLTDDDLIDIAKSKSQEHLLKIANEAFRERPTAHIPHERAARKGAGTIGLMHSGLMLAALVICHRFSISAF